MRILPAAAFLLATLTAPAGAQTASGGPPVDSLLRWAERDSLDARAWFDLGMGYWGRRRYDQADTAFQRAMRLAPHYAEPRFAAALLPFGRGDRYLVDLSHRISDDSMLAFLRGSARLYREAMLFDPLVDPRILRYLGVDELVPRRSLVIGRTVLDLGVPWWEGRAKRGVRHLVEGRYEEAFATLDEALHAREMEHGAVLPDLFIWYYALAAMHATRYDRAAAAYRELAQRAHRREGSGPDWVIPTARADYLYLYAAMSEQAGNVGVAIPAYQEALAVNLGLFQAHTRLADIHETRGDLDRAIVERTRAIDASPDLGKLYVDLGVTLLQAGRPAAAESAFVDAAHLLPNDAGAQRFLAVVALQNAHTETARAALQRFIQVAPVRYSAQVVEARQQLAGLP